MGDNNQYFVDNVHKEVKGKLTDTVESGVSSEGVGRRDGRWGFGVLVVLGAVGVGMAW